MVRQNGGMKGSLPERGVISDAQTLYLNDFSKSSKIISRTLNISMLPVPAFMGTGQFCWFVGVVENRQDPFQLGRVQVRCLGWHSEDLKKLPTKDLPWAHPILPLTTPTAVAIPPEGSWVIGFFRDGESAQEPVLWGVIPAIPAPPKS